MRKPGSRWRWSPAVTRPDGVHAVSRGLLCRSNVAAGDGRDAWHLLYAALTVADQASRPYAGALGPQREWCSPRAETPAVKHLPRPLAPSNGPAPAARLHSALSFSGPTAAAAPT